MKVNIYLSAKNGEYNAKAEYKNGKLTVLKGSKVRLAFAEHIRGGKTAKHYRENPEYVNAEGIVLKDCEFTSPSTAAQFVMGSSTNGWTAWHYDKKTSLRKFIDENSHGGE